MVHKMEGFEADRAVYNELARMISLMGHNNELECKFKEDITKDAFSRMVQYCRSTNMTETLHDDQLDVFCKLPTSPHTIRVSMTGKDNIARYCRANVVPDSSIVIMKRPITGVKQLAIIDLAFKVDLKEEAPLDDFAKQELLTRLPTQDKGYRYKKRFSYEDRNIRYDFTVVKASSVNRNFLCHHGFATSGLIGAPETYEVEIEYTGHGANDAQPKKRGRVSKVAGEGHAVNDLFNAMITIYLIFNDETRYVSPGVKKEALGNYLRLCFGQAVDATLLERNPRSYFAAPQPVTLERRNLAKPDVDVVSILEGYTVTEKADGERCLLFVNSDGHVYLINSRLGIRYTGTKLNNLVNTLIDGEHVTKDVLGKRVSIFGAFDIYFHNTEDVRAKPLIGQGGRLQVLKEMEKRFAPRFEEHGSSTRFFVKRFLHEGSVFDNAKKILDQATTFPYKIDGLIFTPGALGVPKTNGTWDKVFKYKPPEENTIDFLVKFGGLQAGDGRVVQELELYVGYNPQHHTRITAMDFVTGNTRPRRGYIAKRFEPADVLEGSASSAYLQVGEDRMVRCKNGDDIATGTIVEFAWEGGCWVPTRVRRDKTELYARQGLSRTANDISSAMSVWRSIRTPVTHDMITGRAPVPPDEGNDEDTYYFRSISRDKMATKAMLDFHNIWIKNHCLIKPYKGKALLDIACGKAGDLNKWMDARIQKVLGIDYARDNIENPNDGAIARTVKKLAGSRSTNQTKFLYLTMDGGQELGESYFNTLTNKDDRLIARIAWGLERPSAANNALQAIHRFVPSEGFDLVSCQFAIHYFFENKMKLEAFVKNVATHMKKGGYFIGTCLDPVKIRAAFARDGVKELRGEKAGHVVWNVRWLGDTEVEIYMESIGRRMREHLVDFDVLVAAFERYGVRLAKPITSFEEEYERMLADTTLDAATKAKMTCMSNIEKEYSFMNTYFVFQKAGSSPT